MKRFASISIIVVILFATVPLNTLASEAKVVPNGNSIASMDITKKHGLWYKTQILPAKREDAAANFKTTHSANKARKVQPVTSPSEVPHYFGPYPNYAYTPLPKGPITGITLDAPGTGYLNPIVLIDDVYGTGTGATATATANGTGAITNIVLTWGGKDYTAPVVTIMNATDPQGTGAMATATIGDTTGSINGGIRKFVDRLPGLGATNANQNGQYIPIAVPDTKTYPGCDYYVIELGQYTEKLHKDLPTTTLRGYRQVNTEDKTLSKFSYLGPLVIANKDRPVRIKFINKLPTGDAGNLFIPVDHTAMGAGMGPLGMDAKPMNYTENRADIHLHGGFVPWISDGSPHMWTTPSGEKTSYPQGVSVYNVPDMDGGYEPQGTLTFYYNNEQSARLMFFHDHAWGITRLNVYAGEAAGYLITDKVEQDLIAGTNVTGVNPGLQKLLPGLGTPLIIQDKIFVDKSTISAQDPTWKWGTTPPVPNTGDIWYPHVYMPTQNNSSVNPINPFGRWDYAAWFNLSAPAPDLKYPPIKNPYYDPVNAPWEPPMIPGTPHPSLVMEAYMDTPLINGAAYPSLDVEPKAYRFRILNAANDRFWNLQLYVANSTIVTADGRTNTEVSMVPATSARLDTGGVPDPKTAGPSFYQIGTEGGFLPAPAVIDSQPITWNMDPTSSNFGNVDKHSLLLGCAERADVIVDFSKYAGKTLILYNDAPAGFPAPDSRYDYYTGDPDQTNIGGAPSTQAGYGPNTRTIMQINVSATRSDGQPLAPYNLAALNATFAKTTMKRGVFETSQDPILVPQPSYNSAYNANFPDQNVSNGVNSLTFTTLSGKTVTIPLQQKAIQDMMPYAYDLDYGRMIGLLGLELSPTSGTQNYILYPYVSPPVEIINDSKVISEPLAVASDGTQIWKITHNGGDTHPMHFHLYNVQLINRLAMDGKIVLPDANELGWKETVRVNPMTFAIVALRPTTPKNQPFEIPNVIRSIDPSMPDGVVLQGPLGGYKDPQGNPVTAVNHKVNYGWEYVYHCHVLGHEENDMMHAEIFAVAPRQPTDLKATPKGSSVELSWKDNSISETGFTIQRADDPSFTVGLTTFMVGPNVVKYTDTTIKQNKRYYYRVQANNVVGDTTVYPTPSAGFPHTSADSAFSNIADTHSITWNNPADICQGMPLSYDQLDASALDPVSGATIPGIFYYNPDVDAVLSTGQNQPLHVTFVPADSTKYASASKTDYINVNKCSEKHGFHHESGYSTFLPLNWG